MTISISGASASQHIVAGQTVRPFSTVVVSDTVSSATETVLMTLGNVDEGTLSNFSPGLFDPFAGQYLVTGSASAVTAALQALVFTAPLSRASTATFTIDVDDDLGFSASNSTASVVATVTVGGGHTLTEPTGFAESLVDTGNTFDTVYGSDGVIFFSNALASVSGGGDVIHFADKTNNIASLYSTSGHWDTVDGYQAQVYVTGAQASILGGYFAINLSNDAGNAISLYNTNGQNDRVQNGSGLITLNGAQVNLSSGVYTVYFGSGSTNQANFFSAVGWQTVIGSLGQINLNGLCSIVGGGDTIYADYSTASFYGTAGDWDIVSGVNATVILNDAQASVTGFGETIYLDGNPNDAVSLYATGLAWSAVYGSHGSITVNNAGISVLGGGNFVYFGAGSNSVSLYKTQGDADHVTASNGILILNDAQASLVGDDDRVYLNGFYNTLAFAPGFGTTSVYGFAVHDILKFSKSDFADFAALHPVQSGADTLIAREASHAITLANVNAATLTAAQFGFL